MKFKERGIYTKYFRFVSPLDVTGVIFLIVLTLVSIIFSDKIEYWYLMGAVNIIVMFLVIIIVRMYELKSDYEKDMMDKRFSLLKILRFWYAIPLILYCFKEVYLIIHFLHTSDYDIILIRIDQMMFGVNPTQWIYRFANPFITEVLQIIYFLYYIVIIIYGLELYLWRRFDEYKYAAFVILAGFFLSYTAYMIFPAAGPRFYLHNFKSIDKELPGIFFTHWIRVFLNAGESIPANVPNPQDYVQRDAMPSAHAEIAVLLAYLSYKIKSKSFFFYLPYCILMIISTIYLRYHYVIDIIAGLVFAILTLLICNFVYRNKELKNPNILINETN